MGEDGLGDGQEPRSRFGGRGDGGVKNPNKDVGPHSRATPSGRGCCQWGAGQGQQATPREVDRQGHGRG